VSRPSKYPRWADNGGVIVEPTEGKKDIGDLTSEKPPAQYANWWKNLVFQWIAFLDGASALLFGDGGDGDATLDGVATPTFTTLAAGVYTLTHDVHWQNVTQSVPLKTNGYRIYCNGQWTASGTAKIVRDGNNASGRTGGAGLAAGSQFHSGAGGVGALDNSVAPGGGSNVTNSRGGNGGAGGNGQDAGGGAINAGAAGGTAPSPNATLGSWRSMLTNFQGYIVGQAAGTEALTGLRGGAGGGGGGGAEAPNLYVAPSIQRRP